MSEQHEHGTDRAAPGGAAGSSPAGTPPASASPAGPPRAGLANWYGVGPVTFGGMPLIPTAMTTSRKPLPLPMTLNPIPIAQESAAHGSDAHPAASDGGDAGEIASPGAASDETAAGAPPSPMSLQEWLAQAPVSDLSKVHELQARHESPGDAATPADVGTPVEPTPPDDAADVPIEQTPEQPAEDTPIPEMTPITEQEQATPELAEAAGESPAAIVAEPEPISVDDPMSAAVVLPSENAEPIDPPDLFDVAAATPESDGESASEFAGEHVPDDLLFDTWKPEETPAAATAESMEAARLADAAHSVEAVHSAEAAPEPPPAGMDGMTVAEATLLEKDLGTTPAEAELPNVAAEAASSNVTEEMTSLEELEPATEAAAIAPPPLPVEEALLEAPAESPFALTPIVSQRESEPGGDVSIDSAAAFPPATLMDELPSVAATEEVAAEAAPFALTPADQPATADAEPTPAELAAMPPERDVAVAETAVAAGGLVTSADAPETAHDQTASDVFAHAHEDVEGRRGFLSYGILTKLAGLAGLAGCITGVAILLTACAGLTPLNSEKLIAFNGWVMWAVIGLAAVTALQIVWTVLFKTGKVAAIQTAVVTLLVAGLWGIIYFLHDQMAGYDLLLLGEWLAKIGGCGVAVALIGGWIEHRRLREETHVLAALFTNVLAGLGGLFLWMVQSGFKLFPGSGGGH